MAYTIEFAQSVREQLRALSARQRATVLEAIEKQLPYQPLVETKQRKPLRPNPIAPWELLIFALVAGHMETYGKLYAAPRHAPFSGAVL